MIAETDEIFKVTDEMPMFPGCDKDSYIATSNCAKEKMLEYIYSVVEYPEASRTSGAEGVVVVRFIVNKDGDISDIEVIKGIDSEIDKEAIRVVDSMPSWIPGKVNGEAVRVQYNIPIRFKLKND